MRSHELLPGLTYATVTQQISELQDKIAEAETVAHVPLSIEETVDNTLAEDLDQMNFEEDKRSKKQRTRRPRPATTETVSPAPAAEEGEFISTVKKGGKGKGRNPQDRPMRKKEEGSAPESGEKSEEGKEQQKKRRPNNRKPKKPDTAEAAAPEGDAAVAPVAVESSSSYKQQLLNGLKKQIGAAEHNAEKTVVKAEGAAPTRPRFRKNNGAGRAQSSNSDNSPK